MSSLQQAIDEFRERRLKVYREDQDQIIRDVNSANETARDHVGRWIYELIQNSDDAEASELLVQVTREAIYVADNGKGLAPDTVKSLSGTHLSVKPAGAIGRKGLGFKSVYAITRTPQILSHEDGLGFCPERASAWLQEHGIATSKVPYQWLPFWFSRVAEEQQDQVLASLHEMPTIVKLPLAKPSIALKVVQDLRMLPAYVLLTFRHLRRLDVVANDKEKSFSLRMDRRPDIEADWSITDTRENQTQHWRLAKLSLNPPPEALIEFEDEDDRRRAAEVSVAVATLLGTEGQVIPMSEPMMLHVYYPTEEPAPIAVLLHADFVVKSDRSKIVPHFQFNSWLLERLGDHVVDCVEQWYSETAPAANLRLLLPAGDFTNSLTASDLWEHIEARAKSTLRLPDASGKRVLTLGVACRIATSVEPELARQIFGRCGYASRLVLPSLEQDACARRVLDILGCTKLTDADLFTAICSASPELARDAEWLWLCWLWAAMWAVAERKQDWNHEARENRLSRVWKLPIVPVNGLAVSGQSIAGRVVTWRNPETQTLPEWLPVSFIDDWIRDRVLSAAQESPVRVLLAELRVEEPDERIALKALAHAIADFWRTKDGDASRFPNFLASSNFHEQFEPSEELQRCPIRVTIEGRSGNYYVEARRAYFGREWGEGLVADLFKDVDEIAWVKRPVESVATYRVILEWLGVKAHPRLLPDPDRKHDERNRVWTCLPDCTSMGDISAPEDLEGVDYPSLDEVKAQALLRVLVRHWRYYSSHINLSIRYKYYSWYRHSVPARWWEELREELIPPLTPSQAPKATLAKCWLPDKTTRRAVGPLLPTINLDSFGDDRGEVEKWLIEHVGLRTQLAQVSTGEWRDLLQNRIPAVIPAKEAARDNGHLRVSAWYEACLESMSAQEADSSLANVPLLCRKGDTWAYVIQEARWLADDNELAEAFSGNVWQIAFPERLHANARRYFGLPSLSDAKLQPRWDSTTGQAHADLQEKLDTVKPYVFVWRCYKTKQDHEQLRAHLQRLRVRVAEKLEAEVTLSDSLPPKLVTKSVAATEDILLLGACKADLPRLAEAFALSVRTPSDADFFENLLRCESDADRFQKLDARNCPPEQIQRLLQEFRSSAEPQPVETTPSRGAKVEQKTVLNAQQPPASPPPESTPDTPLAPPPAGSAGTTDSTSSDGTSATSPSSSDVQGDNSARAVASKPTQPRQHEKEIQEEASAELNHPDSVLAEFVEVSAYTRTRPLRTRSEQEQSSRRDSESGLASTTATTKDALEQRGREYASRELQRMGYKVTPMGQQNPGYDLLARKPGEILKVEVKAHLGESTNVFVTQREWEEYLKTPQSPAERWELWNVENLAAGMKPKIKPIRHIPRSVPKVSGFWIDLNQCSSHLPVEATKP